MYRVGDMNMLHKYHIHTLRNSINRYAVKEKDSITVVNPCSLIIYGLLIKGDKMM